MQINRPKFMDSEFFVGTPGNWHLKPGAPKDVQDEFTEFMSELNSQDRLDEDPILLDE